jgi:hypothetical protein
MKAALFSIVPYQHRHPHGGCPTPGADYSSDTAQASMEPALGHHEQFVVRRESGLLYP